MLEVLKSCPFCGGPAKIVTNMNQRGLFYTVVKCSTCHSTGRSYRSETDPILDGPENSWFQAAVAAWNMRTEAQNKP